MSFDMLKKIIFDYELPRWPLQGMNFKDCFRQYVDIRSILPEVYGNPLTPYSFPLQPTFPEHWEFNDDGLFLQDDDSDVEAVADPRPAAVVPRLQPPSRTGLSDRELMPPPPRPLAPARHPDVSPAPHRQEAPTEDEVSSRPRLSTVAPLSDRELMPPPPRPNGPSQQPVTPTAEQRIDEESLTSDADASEDEETDKPPFAYLTIDPHFAVRQLQPDYRHRPVRRELTCPCGKEKEGGLIACSNEEHQDTVWYHLSCAGLSREPPKNADWYCADCIKNGHESYQEEQAVDTDPDVIIVSSQLATPAKPTAQKKVKFEASAVGTDSASRSSASPDVQASTKGKASSGKPPKTPPRQRARSGSVPQTPKSGPRTKGKPWTKEEEDACIEVMKDIKTNRSPKRIDLIWEMISKELKSRFGVDRSPAAVKNQWNRVLRERSGFDERANPRADMMTTGLLSSAKKKAATSSLTKRNPMAFNDVHVNRISNGAQAAQPPTAQGNPAGHAHENVGLDNSQQDPAEHNPIDENVNSLEDSDQTHPAQTTPNERLGLVSENIGHENLQQDPSERKRKRATTESGNTNPDELGNDNERRPRPRKVRKIRKGPAYDHIRPADSQQPSLSRRLASTIEEDDDVEELEDLPEPLVPNRRSMTLEARQQLQARETSTTRKRRRATVSDSEDDDEDFDGDGSGPAKKRSRKTKMTQEEEDEALARKLQNEEDRQRRSSRNASFAYGRW